MQTYVTLKSIVMALALMMALFGLAGIPPTIGFTGKLLLFTAAIEKGYLVLVFIAMGNVVVSLYYYLRVMVQMYFKDAEEDFNWVSINTATAISIVIAIAGVLLMGVLPGPFMEMAKLAGF